MKDTRFVYGARCAWFGPISAISTRGGLPCCPHCGSVLYELPDEKQWWDGVDKYDAEHPGYRKFVEWMADKHFTTHKAAAEAYEAETGLKSGMKL